MHNVSSGTERKVDVVEVMVLSKGGKRASPTRFGPARMWPIKKRAGTGWPVK